MLKKSVTLFTLNFNFTTVAANSNLIKPVIGVFKNRLIFYANVIRSALGTSRCAKYVIVSFTHMFA